MRGKLGLWFPRTALACLPARQGYKLHLDVSDIGFPISVHVTGANVHDSQAAILLEKMTMGKVRHFLYGNDIKSEQPLNVHIPI
jgi:hypothetical protein